MWDNEIRRAREHINNGRYTEARLILEDLAEYDDRAHQMLMRLDSIQAGRSKFQHPSQGVIFNQTIQQVNNSGSTRNKGCFGDIPTVALIIIVLNMVFWGLLTVGVAAANSPEAGAQAFIGVTVFFLISFILSYLYWKFYWWMIALSWTILTLVTLCAAVYGVQSLNAFP